MAQPPQFTKIRPGKHLSDVNGSLKPEGTLLGAIDGDHKSVLASLQSKVVSSSRFAGTRSLPISRNMGVHVREASFADYPQICLLEQRYGLEIKDFEEWKHFWDGNPACADLPAWPKGWVLEAERGRVVGFLGNVPRSYQFEGQRFVAAAGHAWVVDSSYRNYAVLLLNPYFRQGNVDVYLCSSANQNSSGILSVFNSARVPVGNWDQSIFWVTDCQGFVASWLRMKDPPAPRMVAGVLSGALKLEDLFRYRSSEPSEDESEVECHDNFDSRFDLFWERLMRDKARFFLAVRSREALAWHFQYALLRKQVWIVTVAGNSGLTGYSVFCRQDNPHYGLRRVRLVDFQVLQGKDSLLVPMLRYALSKSRAEGIHMLECVGISSRVRSLVSSLHPRQRQLPSWSYYYTPANQLLASRLSAPEVWDPTYFDGDSSL